MAEPEAGLARDSPKTAKHDQGRHDHPKDHRRAGPDFGPWLRLRRAGRRAGLHPAGRRRELRRRAPRSAFGRCHHLAGRDALERLAASERDHRQQELGACRTRRVRRPGQRHGAAGRSQRAEQAAMRDFGRGVVLLLSASPREKGESKKA